jgi:phenylpyruvate tautomerase PptA (4-oxalocrotonate tautomerase family)
MPLVTITLTESFSATKQRAIADGVHDAIVAAGFPATDRFQKILRLPADRLIYDPRYPDLPEPRSEQFVLVELLISTGRSGEFKKELVYSIVANLARNPRVDPRDVMVVILETEQENWAFAAGVQYDVDFEGPEPSNP